MYLAKFSQWTGETKRYTVDYAEWLDTGELISDCQFSVEPVTDPALVTILSAIDNDDLTVTFYVSGGVKDTAYDVVLTMTTTGGQVRQDEVKYVISEI